MSYFYPIQLITDLILRREKLEIILILRRGKLETFVMFLVTLRMSRSRKQHRAPGSVHVLAII